MNDRSLTIYLKQIHDVEPISEKEELNLFRISKGKGKKSKAARLRLIETHLPLVISLAKKYYYPSLRVEFMHFVAEGNIGLIKAVERFDPDKEFKFSTYASWWIEKYFQEAILNARSVIHIPEKKLRDLKKIEDTTSTLLQETGSRPNYGEIAEKIDMSIAKVRDTLVSALKIKYVKSLDYYIDSDKTGTLKDITASKDDDLEQIMEHMSAQQQLDALLELLNDEEKQVLKLRFGLNNIKNHTYKEIAEKMDISATKARDIQDIAIRKLRKIALLEKIKVDKLEKKNNKIISDGNGKAKEI